MPLADLNQSDRSSGWYKSLNVSFELPRYAAKKLHDLAIAGDRRLKDIGILKVQVRELRDADIEKNPDRPRRGPDANGNTHYQKSPSLQSGPPVVTVNTTQPFPWHYQQSSAKFTYYSSPHQPQLLMRDKADVRLYTLPTNDREEYRTKIIGISRGVLTDESIPIDSKSQEHVPLWLIESSLCISFRRHGKCDVACQTGSEKILYRPRPGSFRYDMPIRHGLAHNEPEQNRRQMAVGNKATSYRPHGEKSANLKEVSAGRCSSESIRILESLANSLVTADEKAGKALSGDYPVPKSNQTEVRQAAVSSGYVNQKLSDSSVIVEGHFPIQRQNYRKAIRDEVFAYYGENSQNDFYKQHGFVSQQKNVLSRSFSDDCKRTAKDNVNGNRIRRVNSESNKAEKDVAALAKSMTSPVSIQHSFSGSQPNIYTASITGKAVGINEETVKDRGQSPVGGTMEKVEKAAGFWPGVCLSEMKPDEAKQKCVAGGEFERAVDRNRSLEVHQVSQLGLSRNYEVATINESDVVKTQFVEGREDSAEERRVAESDSKALDRGLPAVIPRHSYGFFGGSLPISVNLDSDYLRGITARGNDGKFKKAITKNEKEGERIGSPHGPVPEFRKPIVKERQYKEMVGLQQEVNSEFSNVKVQTGVGYKRKRGRPPKSEMNMGNIAIPEQTKRKRGRPPKAKTIGMNNQGLETNREKQSICLTQQTWETLDAGIVNQGQTVAEKVTEERAEVKLDQRSEAVVAKGKGDKEGISPGLHLNEQESKKIELVKNSVNKDAVSFEETKMKRSLSTGSNDEVFVEKSGSSSSSLNANKQVTDQTNEIRLDSKGNGKIISPTQRSSSATPKVISATSLPLRRHVHSSSSRPTSPCETDIKVRSRSHRWYQKDSIHREIEELYVRLHPSVACETEQLLPDDIYYGENYPIIFADDDQIGMKFVDMSTAFKLAMKEKLATNFSTRDERRGVIGARFVAGTKVLTGKTKPQQDVAKKDASLYDKMQRKRAAIESKAVKSNQSKRKSIDYSSDTEFVADRTLRRSVEEEAPSQPSHQMSLRPRRVVAMGSEYLSSDSLDDEDTEADTGSFYESDESSDSEPLINKVRISGKTSEKASKQIIVSPKFSVSSDDDGERHTKLSYLSGMSGLNRELERSESVSTNESDTFDIIPSKKKNPSEPKSVISQTMTPSDMKNKAEISRIMNIDGNLGDKSSTKLSTETDNVATKVTSDCLTKEVVATASAVLLRDGKLQGENVIDKSRLDEEKGLKSKSDVKVGKFTTDDKSMFQGEFTTQPKAKKYDIEACERKEASQQNEGVKEVEKTRYVLSESEHVALQREQIIAEKDDVQEFVMSRFGHIKSKGKHVIAERKDVTIAESGHVISESGNATSKVGGPIPATEHVTSGSENLIFGPMTSDTRRCMVEKEARDTKLGSTEKQKEMGNSKLSVKITETSSGKGKLDSSYRGVVDGSHDGVASIQDVHDIAEKCYAESASINESFEGGSRITRLIKRSIQKISNTLGKVKEKNVFKDRKDGDMLSESVPSERNVGAEKEGGGAETNFTIQSSKNSEKLSRSSSGQMEIDLQNSSVDVAALKLGKRPLVSEDRAKDIEDDRKGVGVIVRETDEKTDWQGLVERDFEMRKEFIETKSKEMLLSGNDKGSKQDNIADQSFAQIGTDDQMLSAERAEAEFDISVEGVIEKGHMKGDEGIDYKDEVACDDMDEEQSITERKNDYESKDIPTSSFDLTAKRQAVPQESILDSSDSRPADSELINEIDAAECLLGLSDEIVTTEHAEDTLHDAQEKESKSDSSHVSEGARDKEEDNVSTAIASYVHSKTQEDEKNSETLAGEVNEDKVCDAGSFESGLSTDERKSSRDTIVVQSNSEKSDLVGKQLLMEGLKTDEDEARAVIKDQLLESLQSETLGSVVKETVECVDLGGTFKGGAVESNSKPSFRDTVSSNSREKSIDEDFDNKSNKNSLCDKSDNIFEKMGISDGSKDVEGEDGANVFSDDRIEEKNVSNLKAEVCEESLEGGKETKLLGSSRKEAEIEKDDARKNITKDVSDEDASAKGRTESEEDDRVALTGSEGFGSVEYQVDSSKDDLLADKGGILVALENPERRSKIGEGNIEEAEGDSENATIDLHEKSYSLQMKIKTADGLDRTDAKKIGEEMSVDETQEKMRVGDSNKPKLEKSEIRNAEKSEEPEEEKGKGRNAEMDDQESGVGEITREKYELKSVKMSRRETEEEFVESVVEKGKVREGGRGERTADDNEEKNPEEEKEMNTKGKEANNVNNYDEANVQDSEEKNGNGKEVMNLEDRDEKRDKKTGHETSEEKENVKSEEDYAKITLENLCTDEKGKSAEIGETMVKPENETTTHFDQAKVKHTCAFDFVVKEVAARENSGKLTGASKRRRPEEESEANESKLQKLDEMMQRKAEAEEIPSDVKGSSQAEVTSAIAVDGKKEGNVESETAESPAHYETRKEGDNCDRTLRYKEGSNIERENDPFADTGSKSEIIDSSYKEFVSDKLVSEKDTFSRKNDQTGNKDSDVSSRNIERGSDIKNQVERAKTATDRGKVGKTVELVFDDRDVNTTVLEAENRSFKPEFDLKESDDIEKENEDTTDGDENEENAKEIVSVNQEGVELTDAFKRILQYQESSDDETLFHTTTDEESMDSEKDIISQKTVGDKSHPTFQFVSNSVPSQADTNTGQKQLLVGTPKVAGNFVGRTRRYSTTEADTKHKIDGPKRRKSTADSDLTDGSHVVLTRRMKRETACPAKRLRSSRS